MMELAELGKQPIRPDQPAGDDARYDPLYEELVAEVDKFSSPSASGALEWDKVVKLSSDILSRKSKDLLVASYLAISLIQTKKFEGVEIGSRIIRDLIEFHWDALFPAKSRMRGRIAAIEWWAEKAEGVLEQIPKGPYAEERINALNENLQKVDDLLSGYLEEAPSIRPLLDFVGTLEAIAPPPEPKASEPKPASAEPRPPEGSLGTLGAEPSGPRVEEGPGEISSSETAYVVIEKALGDVARVAGYFREESLSNPTAFRLARVAAWSAMESLPPSEDGRTNIPPPYTADSLRGLLGEGQDEALVRAAEQNLEQHIFWLDLNFWAAEALARLGEGHQAAAEAVRGETALLLRRLPGLEDLKFSDGTPFAADDTREWLKGLSAGSGAAEGSAGTAADPAAKGARQAREMIAEGRTAEAVRRMQQGLRGCSSRKEAFHWRVALCRLLVETPEARHALPHIDEILKEIDLFHLEEYDPEIALKGLKVAWDGFRANAGLVPEERVAEMQGRIARVDVSAAMSLGGE